MLKDRNEKYQILIECKNLSKFFFRKKLFAKSSIFLKANDDISLSIHKGQTLAVVGGSGKSTLGQTLLQLEKSTSGKVIYYKEQQSINLSELSTKDLQIIFQNPYLSLNPKILISDIIGEGLLIHNLVKSKNDPLYKQKILDIMKKCGVKEELYNRSLAQLSGGERQRIAIARTLIIEPKFIVCDEIVSLLDVTIQKQILELLKQLKKNYELTLLFITHDLGVAKYLSDQIAIMYLGKLVELGPTEKIFTNPQHPYTIELLNSIPKLIEYGISSKKYIAKYENSSYDFLYNKKKEDKDWHQVSPNHFILCTKKRGY
uniref:ABC transporter homolog n=1 Tax=Loofah witches'-broom phytoplasma TaxID=35773 RepID=Q9S512_LOWBP|nr:ABC transporter homolog [Candidatus Phytoplasma luffae]